MTDIDAQIREIFGRILRDIQVELGDEFDQNFERQGFFSEKWARRKSPTRPGGLILVDSGALRQSIRSEIRDSSIVFLTDHPAAAIHNEGGEIKVTRKMKGYFFAKLKEIESGYSYKKNGEKRDNRRNRTLSDKENFYRAMALKKVGSTITIPERRFIGNSKTTDKIIREIAEQNIDDYFKRHNIITK